MTGVIIEQAVFVGEHIRGQSAGFDERLIADAELMVREFGALAHGVESLFVRPLGRNRVAVVQVRGSAFLMLAVPKTLFQNIPDPFEIARRYPADFGANGQLAELHWDESVVSPREISAVRAVLKSDDGPTLLGAAQALVEGGRVAFAKPAPDPTMVERLWLLLPESTRAELSVATFSRSTKNFDVVVTPLIDDANYLSADNAAEYPEGPYELNLQIAVESDDADAMHRLFARRSGSQAMRLMLRILLLAGVVGLTARLLQKG